MKALQIHTLGDTHITEVPEPTPGPTEAIVEVEWCGICGSDLSEFTNGPLAVAYNRVSKDEWRPMTLGHEIAGRIRSVPRGSQLKPGDAVVVNPMAADGECGNCVKYGESSCPQRGCVGLSGAAAGGGDGGLAQFVAVDVRKCYKIPNNLPLHLAALAEPMCVAWHAAKAPGFSTYEGKTVLIVGCGPVGLYLMFALRNKGAAKIIASETMTARREMAIGIADLILDPSDQDVAKKCRDLTGGEGVDVTFDVAGSKPGLEGALKSLKYGGTHVTVAVWPGMTILVPWREMMMANVTMRGSTGYDAVDWREVIEELGEGRFPGIEKTITGMVNIDEAVEKGFKALVNDKEKHVKILVSPKAVEAH